MTEYEVHLKIEALEQQMLRLQETVSNITANDVDRALKAVVVDLYAEKDKGE